MSHLCEIVARGRISRSSLRAEDKYKATLTKIKAGMICHDVPFTSEMLGMKTIEDSGAFAAAWSTLEASRDRLSSTQSDTDTCFPIDLLAPGIIATDQLIQLGAISPHVDGWPRRYTADRPLASDPCTASCTPDSLVHQVWNTLNAPYPRRHTHGHGAHEGAHQQFASIVQAQLIAASLATLDVLRNLPATAMIQPAHSQSPAVIGPAALAFGAQVPGRAQRDSVPSRPILACAESCDSLAAAAQFGGPGPAGSLGRPASAPCAAGMFWDAARPGAGSWGTLRVGQGVSASHSLQRWDLLRDGGGCTPGPAFVRPGSAPVTCGTSLPMDGAGAGLRVTVGGMSPASPTAGTAGSATGPLAGRREAMMSPGWWAAVTSGAGGGPDAGWAWAAGPDADCAGSLVWRRPQCG
jgi:hypothetical protein